MSTIREQIVAAVATALTVNKPSGVPTPVRTRIDSPATEQLPALTVYQGIEKVDTAFPSRPGQLSRGPVVRRALDVIIEVLTKASADAPADKAADPILAWATAALCADGALAGLAKQVDEVGTKFDYEQGEASFCRASMTVRIGYQTRVDNAELVT